jgi:probable phosphoglycerate mutase
VKLILIRHGESLHSQRRLVAGERSCLGLTERGQLQACRLADRARRSGEFDQAAALLCSPIQRARQTAEALAEALSGLRLQVEPDLAELLPGDADGLVWDAYEQQFGSFDIMAEPHRPFAPGGESWNSFRSRVAALLQLLAERHAASTVLAVTHGGFITMALMALFDIPRPGTGARVDPGFTSITEWNVTNAVWRLERFNDMAHLSR